MKKQLQQVTKEDLQTKFNQFIEQQKLIEKKVDELGILYNKLEGAKEALQMLIKELSEQEQNKDVKE